MFLYSVLYLLGGAYVLWEGKHIRVDVFYMRFSKRMQAVVDIIFLCCLFFPVCLGHDMVGIQIRIMVMAGTGNQ